jgi:hypothetical protein
MLRARGVNPAAVALQYTKHKGVASIVISAGRFPERTEIVGTTGRVTIEPPSHHPTALTIKVRKTPSWPRSWANSSLLQLYSHRNVRANLHLLGQPNSFLAQGRLPEAPRQPQARAGDGPRRLGGRL